MNKKIKIPFLLEKHFPYICSPILDEAVRDRNHE
ncbi:MAG: hypothetical protein ACI9Z3_001140, partial [Roseivirga sp.]